MIPIGVWPLLQYELMHKEVKVAVLSLSEDDGSIQDTKSICSIQHMSVGTVRSGILDGKAFKHWWRGRSIPASRNGLKEVLDALNVSYSTLLIEKSMGLSLSDQYWIRPIGSDISWHDVNYFDNAFSEDMGDMLFGIGRVSDDMDLSSPDNTSDGVLKKRWKIIDGGRYLIKGGSGQVMQEPFNEVIASILMESQGIEHVPYELMWIDGLPYSSCKDFITRDSELVTAYHFSEQISKRNDESLYSHFCKLSREAGIDPVPYLDRMMVIDYIMANDDRHMGNFGFIRDAETLEYKGAAPIFDTGTSLGCQVRTDRFEDSIPKNCKPFRKTFEEQISLVSDFRWLDIVALESSLDDVERLLDTRGFIGDERRDKIMSLLSERIRNVSFRI